MVLSGEKRFKENGWIMNSKEDRPNMFYPFFYDKDKNILSLDEFLLAVEILPMKDSTTEGCWRWGKDTSKEEYKNLYGYIQNKAIGASLKRLF